VPHPARTPHRIHAQALPRSTWPWRESARLENPQAALERLILETLAAGPNHGFGIAHPSATEGLTRVRRHAYIVDSVPSFAILGEFEVVVLMAVLHLGDAAYGSAIRDDIERRSGRRVARGAVYITLERLEEKGLLGSKLEGASARRGGRPKRLFRVTPAGIRSLKHALALVTRMHKGLEPILGDL
jgi:PadR family transcriptional regulator, regulatory protein PadR